MKLPRGKVLHHVLLAALLLAVQAPAAWAASTFDQVKAAYQPSDTLVLDRHGDVIQRQRTDATVRRGQWVALADISPALRNALLVGEDKRFYEHSGVDWRAASAAAWGNLWNTRTRGASTITMQLAGLLDEDLRASSGGRSLLQKFGQTIAAQTLERNWRKDQILEAYLNLVPFRGELVGIDALSRTLFNKAAHGLDEREAAVASALVRGPNAKVAQVAQRACSVLTLLQPPASPDAPASKVDCEGLDMFASVALQRRAFDATEGVAPHLARRLLREAAQSSAADPANAASAATPSVSEATLRSTVHAPLQRFAVQTLTQHLRELHGRHVEDGALVVLDNRSGEVLAWVGSSGSLSAAAQVDGVLAMRQPGSTLKPFLYAQAIAERRLTAASLIEDSSAQIATSGGLYVPQNYDRQFKGLVSARTALGASLNVPAVRTLVMVTPDAFHKQLKAVGLPLRESGDYYGYSLALGSSEVTLLDLTNAYRTLANGGRYSPTLALLPAPARVRMVGQGPAKSRPALVPPSTAVQALDSRAAFIVTDILADRMARARTFGTDSILATRFWSAVKTGTSKDMRDNWAVGFSEHYTVGVWVGNASGAPMWDVSGSSGAAPVWASVMNHLHHRLASQAPKPPPGVVLQATQFGEHLEAARDEWFIQGTEQSMFAINSRAASAISMRDAALKGIKNTKNKRLSAEPVPDASAQLLTARILSPTNGTIIALDPDIPPNRQRLIFSAEGLGVRWTMDGKEFARGIEAKWRPWPGRHVVQLLDASGKVVDEIKFEVRGAGVREASARSSAKALR